MIDDVVDIVGGKVLQDGDDYCAVGDCRHVGYAPVSVVFADNGNFISSAEAATLEQPM